MAYIDKMLAVAAMALTISCSGDGGGYGDGESEGKENDISNYRTVVIGTQIWMAENLNYDVEGGVCYDNSSANCEKYGRLYDWATAMGLPPSCNSNSCSGQIQSPHQGICPDGWHIPRDEEWYILVSYAGGSAGTKLKAASGWNSFYGVSGNGTDEYGFSALPGGIGYSNGSFSTVGYSSLWWTASEDNSDEAYYRRTYYDVEGAGWSSNDKSLLFSVRCLKD